MPSPEETISKLRTNWCFKGVSWLQRSRRRSRDIRRLSWKAWYVRGTPSLGDRRQFYLVLFDESREYFRCTCYDLLSPYSGRRRKEMCTHVGAVVLSLMDERRAQRPG